MEKNNKFPTILLAIFSLYWIYMAINPTYRLLWFVENLLMVGLVVVLVSTYKNFRFSNTSYFLIFLFSLMQITGAHYSYAEVPIDLITNYFDFERNHFDRIAHFSFGLFFAVPLLELFRRKNIFVEEKWAYIFVVVIAFATGAIYEILEWLYVLFGDSRTSASFLGAQGDVWDAQIDMFLEGLGASISMSFLWFFKKKP